MKSYILIAGALRSGKDTSANIFNTEFHKIGFDSQIVSLASPLKGIIARTFDISTETLDMYKNAPDSYKLSMHGQEFDFRSILQRFGTEGMKREFGDTVWVDALLRKTKDSSGMIIVPDVRFPEEVDTFLVNSMGDNSNVFLYKVQNPRIIHNHTHSSENALNDYKTREFKIIDNSGSLDDLNVKILDIITNEMLQFLK
jgi:hypothetical protein